MKRGRTSVLTCILAATATAAPLSPAARSEIDGLTSKLETPDCEFNRNGTWHSGTEAKTHLLRKLKYLEDKGVVRRTEQFIEVAASASSMTGQPYLVRCGNSAPIRSGAWLSSQLRTIRLAGPVKGAR